MEFKSKTVVDFHKKEFEIVSEYFSYPILEASIKLGMEMSDLRRICKANGLSRWPFSYKRKNEPKTKGNETSFIKFSLPEKKVQKPVEYKLKGVQKIGKIPKICTNLSKVDVKNLLN